MSYHPKDVADFGTAHGYDLSNPTDVKELAAEYVRSGKAPGALAASTIEWHLEHFLKGERVGLYEPDGTTRTTEPDDADTQARKIIATWTRGLITLSEMVSELQKVADSETRKALQAGADIAAARRTRS